MAEGSENSLNFDSAHLENLTTELARKIDPLKDYLMPAFSVLLFFLAVFLSILLFKKLKNNSVVEEKFLMAKIPLPLRIAMLPLLIGYAFTHVFSAVAVFYNTNVVNPSTFLYFQSMGVGRLYSLTHAHLFAHATMYFVLAVLVQLTGAGFVFTVLAPLVALWAGVFDVFSWWGIKLISPNFEWLSIACGSLFSVSFLLMAFAILRSALCCQSCTATCCASKKS